MIVRMDDVRLGRALRALRLRRGLRQADVAVADGVAQSTISLIERGHWSTLSMRTVRRVFAVVDARFEGQLTLRGGALERLLDERHAELVGAFADRFAVGRLGGGDRGDLLGVRGTRCDRHPRRAAGSPGGAGGRGENRARIRRGDLTPARCEGPARAAGGGGATGVAACRRWSMSGDRGWIDGAAPGSPTRRRPRSGAPRSRSRCRGVAWPTDGIDVRPALPPTHQPEWYETTSCQPRLPDGRRIAGWTCCRHRPGC